MELFKTIVMVSASAAAGSFFADFAEPQITKRVAADASAGTKRAIRLGTTATGAVLTFGALRMVF